MAKRRALNTYLSPEEKAERRRAHADAIADAVAALESPDGFRDWIGSLILCDDLSPLNCALVARGMPGRVVTTTARWRARGGYSVLKGARAQIQVTAPGFVPRAAFCAEQVGATDLLAELEANPPRMPAADELDRMRQALCGRLSGDGKRSRVVAAYGCELRAGALTGALSGSSVLALAERMDADEVTDEIPF